MREETIACPHCGAVVPTTFRFCGACGRPLMATCRHCGASVPAAFRFCGTCGSPVDPTQDDTTVPDGAGLPEQRRVVSVLVADLEGSTQLATTLDAEDLHHTVQPLLDALAEEVEAHGGTLQRYAGDGVVAVFGAPVARGDDPVRAVRAGRAMQERLARLNASGGLRAALRMRVGVATGDVVTIAGDPDLARATGDAFNLASRLQTVAPTGGVAVDRRTWHDTRHVVAYRQTDGPHHLKGFPEPLTVWVAADERARDARYRLPLVGRTTELRMLATAMRATIAAHAARSVTVTGEAGVGKSRLVHEFVTTGVPDAWPDARVVVGRCLPYGRGLALWPLAEILRSDLGARLGEPAEQIAERARHALLARWRSPDGADLVPVLLASVGLPAATGTRDLTSSRAASRDIVARLVGRAWTSYLQLLADGDALVVRIEDLHWGDEDLLGVLGTVLETARFPLFVVATTRPRPDLDSVLRGDMIALAPLDRADMDELLLRLLGDAASSEVISALGERAAGNPFFAEQLVEMLREEGLLTAAGDAGSSARVRLPERLPDNVQAAIGARLDLLSPPELSVVLHAAVVGRSWWPGVVTHLLGHPVDAEVDRLVARGMCVPQLDSDVRGEAQVMFTHVLLRDVAYERVPRRMRPRLHRDVGRWLESRAAGREQEIAEILAHHFELAQEHEATARYALLAGERKLSLYAADDAIAWLDRAQTAIAHGDQSDAEDLACRIALRTGAAHEQLGQFAVAEQHYQHALRAAERARRDDERAEALASAAHVLWLQDAYDRAEPLLAEALVAATKVNRTDLVSQVEYTTGTINLGRGQYEKAARAQRDALATARAAGDREAEAAALHGLSEALAIGGPLGTALEHSVSCSRLARDLGWLPMLHHNECMRGWILMWMGRFREADEALVNAGEGALALGDPRNAAQSFAGLGYARWLCDDTAGAWDSFHRAEELERRFQAPRTLLMIRGHELFALAGDDRWPEVRAHLDVSWEASDATGGAFLRAHLYAWEGWLALRDGERDLAARWFDRARAGARDVHTERWYALHVELLACLGSGVTERLVDIAAALRDLDAESSVARALGDLALASAAVATAVPEAVETIDRAEQIAEDLPPRYRQRWWRSIARLHEHRGEPDDAAAARLRAERPPTSDLRASRSKQ
jgi:class 3 adenylate cyclase/tetratricopeptide (TPR) repeat protein